VSEFAAFRSFELSERDAPGFVPPYIEQMFPEQRAAYDDPRKNKVYLCTRRSGKTHCDAVDVYETSRIKPNSDSMVLSTTRGHAYATVGKALNRLIQDYGLPLREKIEHGRLCYHNTETNHRTWINGCKDFREAEKLRGDYLERVWIDECGAFPIIPDMTKDDGSGRGKFLLEYLVEDILSPRLMDKGGGMVLSGSPGVVLKGYWWEITTGNGAKPKWEAHHAWSLLQNPYMLNVKAELEERKKTFGWSESSATYQREWLGRWVEDKEALVYKYNAQLNGLNWGPYPACLDVARRELGEDLWWGLGIDLGHRDATAFTLMCAPHGKPGAYYLRAWGGSELTQPLRAAEIYRVQMALRERGARLDACVIDTGGGGAMIAHDLSTSFGLSIEAATKPEKAAGIRMMQGDLARGHVKVNVGECGHLLGEWSVLPWNEERTNHSDNYPDHWSDSALYIRRRMPNYERWERTLPEPGTPEAVDLERSELKARAAKVNSLRMQLARARTLSERHDLQRQLQALAGH
jgi:hypothetical protein